MWKHTTLAATLLATVVAATVQAASDEAPFRRAHWGMTQAEVRVTEDLPIARINERVITYESGLARLDVRIIYSFNDDGKLEKAGHVFDEVHRDPQGHVTDFDRIRSLLERKYGSPVEDEQFWGQSGSTEADDGRGKRAFGLTASRRSGGRIDRDKEHWGERIADQALALLVRWESDDTEIIMNLSGETGEIVHGLLYKSLIPLGPSKEELEEQALDDL